MKKLSELKNYFIIILFACFSFWAFNHMEVIWTFLKYIINISLPFLIGGSLAFLINIPMSFFESKLKSKIKNPKLLRTISLCISLIIIIAILALIVGLIIPEIYGIIKLFIQNTPEYVNNLIELLNKYDITTKIDFNTAAIQDGIKTVATGIFNNSLSVIGSIFSVISTSFIAIVFAIYILITKESLLKGANDLMNAYLPKNGSNKIRNNLKIIKKTFSTFFTVQCLEACILGVLCALGMAIFKLPYVIPISILVGVTALIPIVGAFIGALVGSILIGSISISKAIFFLVFFVVLQQIEGNVIYPKVVGNSLGLPGIWVLVAVTIGGSILGILGMLISVPITCVIYSIIKENVKKKLNK